uniref:Uncharacterized protein n=1 Tax=Brassica oleracea TaxID=3712 RepID=A0A3P6GRB3_BRAOL|nr:unnamed protein product [Brassica oleracea]
MVREERVWRMVGVLRFSIEGVHDSYIVVISGRWIMCDTGDWDFKLDSDRMGRAVYAKLITSVEDLKRAIIESYGLVGMSVAVEMSYWLGFRLVYFGT